MPSVRIQLVHTTVIVKMVMIGMKELASVMVSKKQD